MEARQALQCIGIRLNHVLPMNIVSLLCPSGAARPLIPCLRGASVRRSCLLLPLLLALMPLACHAGVDRVLVKKSQRRLYLLENGKTVDSFRVSLGDHPSGRKYFEGDGRTPEGTYTLDWRNPNSLYHKSIHISYPTAAERRQARALGFSPGGNIMIHGLPNDAGKWAFAFRGLDWTDGCIAVSNRAMDVIWREVDPGTPITIEP